MDEEEWMDHPWSVHDPLNAKVVGIVWRPPIKCEFMFLRVLIFFLNLNSPLYTSKELWQKKKKKKKGGFQGI
jgi:hypothetical protein